MSERIIVIRTRSKEAFEAVVDRLEAERIHADVREYGKTSDTYRRLDEAQHTVNNTNV